MQLCEAYIVVKIWYITNQKYIINQWVTYHIFLMLMMELFDMYINAC